MEKRKIAVPVEKIEGVNGSRSDHFGHCPAFALVEIKDGQIAEVSAVDNIAHEAGGCMKPVAMLAEHGVDSLVVSGIGRGPFQRLQQHGIKVYFADLEQYPDLETTVAGFIGKKLPVFGDNQLCKGSGNCHH